MFELFRAAKLTWDWSLRRRELRSSARARIEEEGGEVRRTTIIGLLIRSPFPRINPNPVYLRIDCRYPEDQGTWFLCESDRGTTWAWRSDIGSPRLPAPRDDGAILANDIVALPAWLGVAGYAGLIAGIIYGITRL